MIKHELFFFLEAMLEWGVYHIIEGVSHPIITLRAKIQVWCVYRPWHFVRSRYVNAASMMKYPPASPLPFLPRILVWWVL